MKRLITKTLLPTILGIAVSMASQISVAQSLRGLKTATIVVDERSQDERNCGISSKTARTAVAFVLQQSRLRIVDNQQDGQGFFLVGVTSISTGGESCVGVISISLRTATQGNTQFGKLQQVVAVYQDGTLVAASPSSFAKIVTDAIESLTKAFVVAWADDNPL